MKENCDTPLPKIHSILTWVSVVFRDGQQVANLRRGYGKRQITKCWEIRHVANAGLTHWLHVRQAGALQYQQ